MYLGYALAIGLYLTAYLGSWIIIGLITCISNTS